MHTQEISRGKSSGVHSNTDTGVYKTRTLVIGDFVFSCRLFPCVVTPQIQFVYLASLLIALAFLQTAPRGDALGLSNSSGSPP